MSYLGIKRRRDMQRQRWQFLAVLVTIVLGVMLFAASYDAYRNLEASYTDTYDRLAFADMTVTGADDANAATPRLDPPPTLTVLRGGAHASRVVLPVMPSLD